MLCQQHWSLKLGTNARSLAREFARDNRVLYVTMPLDVKALLRGFRQPEVRQHLRIVLGLRNGLSQPEPNIWVYTPGCLALSINWVTSRRVFRALNKLNAWALARSIRAAARTVGFEAPYFLLDGIIFQGTELKRLLRPQQFIYYLRDYMLDVPYFRRHGPAVEAQLLRRADVVATNSAYLRDYAAAHNPRSYDIGQGCELALYQPQGPYEEPADLARVPHPRLGYTGFLTSVRLDLDLLVAIARHRPHWHLVLVGPEDEAFRRSALHTLPNVHFLGNKLPGQLPAYVHHFAACLNPQLNNATTAGNYPLKVDEYLAMGKPVVATHTRTMELFAAHVHLARTPADWLTALAAALAPAAPGRTARGIAFARSHTWAASTARLGAALAAGRQPSTPEPEPELEAQPASSVSHTRPATA